MLPGSTPGIAEEENLRSTATFMFVLLFIAGCGIVL
jgi:hypothetical protein